MFQPSDGLRFDVYERVHLPQDVADIHELEEIELTPYIQVVRQDEQVLLKGHLLLSGVYSSQGDAVEARTLEHWIPVEITLPVNRVNRPEDITVDIENFDVDLLSARTLNITGVLSLKGIEARDNEPSAAYAWGDEPFTVVHRRDPASEGSQRFESSEDQEIPGNPVDPQSSISSERFADSASPEGPESLEVAEAERTADYASQDRDAAVNAMNAFVEDQLKARTAAAAPPFVPGGTGVADVSAESSHAAQPDNREAEPPAVAGGWHAIADAESTVPFPTNRSRQEDRPEFEEPETPPFSARDEAFAPATDEFELPQSAQPDPAKAEMRIAFGAARGVREPAADDSVGLISLLHAGRREQELRRAAEQDQAKQQAEREIQPPPGDDIVWQNLFLGKQQDEQEFRRLRMCIVQREDTLETIAGRYQLNPREIILFNRLSANNVSVGQVLMIP